MLYNLRSFNFNNTNCDNQNVLVGRSFFVPFSNFNDCKSSTSIDKYAKSKLLTCLDGEWDFKFLPSVEMLSEAFDSTKENFDKICIPNNMQVAGRQKPIYLSNRLPFKYNPPKIPVGFVPNFFTLERNRKIYVRPDNIYNSASVYRKFLNITDIEKSYTLSFAGVNNYFELHINGKYVGCSDNAFCVNEFLINEYLVEGNNEILVVVTRWCVASYLDCIDMFKTNGIFRSVYLKSNDKNQVYDFRVINTKNKNSSYNLFCEIEVLNHKNTSLQVELFDGEKQLGILQAQAKKVTQFEFANLIVEEWNELNAKIYHLYISLLDENGKTIECIKQNVGFKNIKINKNTFTLNGVPIKLKGVNYLESGKNLNVLTQDELIKDIQLIKQYNFNCIKLPYVPSQMVCDLCAENGIYLVPDVGISLARQLIKYNYKSNPIGASAKWEAKFMLRAKSLYSQLKNSTAVIMWSLGKNLAGSIKCVEPCYTYLKGVSALPVICEGISACSDISCVEDIKIATLTKNVVSKTFIKPLLFTKFAKAQGMGAGKFSEFFNIMSENEFIVGGFVHQFAEQVMEDVFGQYYNKTDIRTGEFISDGLGSLCGLFNNDREANTSAHNIKAVFSAIKISYENNQLSIINTSNFEDTSNLKISYSIYKNSLLIKTNEVNKILAPRDRMVINLNLKIEGDLFVNVNCTNKLSSETTVKQIVLSEKLPEVIADTGNKISVLQREDFITIDFDNGYAKFITKTGKLANYVVNAVEYVNQKPTNLRHNIGFFPTLFRLPFDNENHLRRTWIFNGYHSQKLVLKGISANKIGNEVVCQIKYLLVSHFKKIFFMNDVYTFKQNGAFDVKSIIMPKNPNLPPLAKFGKGIELADNFNKLNYFGRGEIENYPDFKEHTFISKFSSTAESFGHMKTKPAETGNRCDVRYLEVLDENNNGLVFVAKDKFLNVNVKKYTDDVAVKWLHKSDVCLAKTTFVSIDGYVKNCGRSDDLQNKTKPELNPNKTNTIQFSVYPSCVIKEIN